MEEGRHRGSTHSRASARRRFPRLSWQRWRAPTPSAALPRPGLHCVFLRPPRWHGGPLTRRRQICRQHQCPWAAQRRRPPSLVWMAFVILAGRLRTHASQRAPWTSGGAQVPVEPSARVGLMGTHLGKMAYYQQVWLQK